MDLFIGDDILKDAVKAFAETVALKVRQLRRFVPKEKALTNSDLTGAFIEELVRGFIRNWIRQQLLLHGTFHSEKLEKAGEKPLQIDGIIYDPKKGPLTLREGDFVVVHPAFCSAVIEIKMTVSDMRVFEDRLRYIHAHYLNQHPSNHAMGVVIAAKDPEKVSQCSLFKEDVPFHNYWTGGLCPIFVLFKETDDGEYEPFYEAIEAMICAIYRNTTINAKYF